MLAIEALHTRGWYTSLTRAVSWIQQPGSLRQLYEIEVPHPHSQDPGLSDIFLGNPMGVGICGHREGHIPWRFTESGPHSGNQDIKTTQPLRRRIKALL